MRHYHPRQDDHGKRVEIAHPSQPTALCSWQDAAQMSTTVPDAAMPERIGGTPVDCWMDAPAQTAGWEALAQTMSFEEPPLCVKPGNKPASGVVVVEADGRVWLVSPSNRFGGYSHTFPKGTIFPGDNISLRANALKEAYEESGLKVELVSFLLDAHRTTTTTRYYLARRLGGNPSQMGWESQAVHLVPPNLLPRIADHPNDAAIVQAILKRR